MRCHASQRIMAGSTRVVSSPLPETSLLARSCNKAERERYFVFGESLPSRFSRSLLRSPCPYSRALAYGARGSRSLDPAWSCSSAREARSMSQGVGIRSAYGRHGGLRVRPGDERPVANDNPAIGHQLGDIESGG